MMNYQQFKEKVEEQIRDYLPQGLQDIKITFGKTFTINKVRDHVCFEHDSGNVTINPILYIDDMYERYSHFQDFNAAVVPMLDSIKDVIENNPILKERIPILPDESEIFYQLVNTKQNEEYLKTLPHRQFKDLSLIYRWDEKTIGEQQVAGIITHNVAEQMGYNENQLYTIATMNRLKYRPTIIKPIESFMTELWLEALFGVRREKADMNEVDVEDAENPIYIMTNKMRKYGAVAMFDGKALQTLAEKLESDLYVLPSSIHDVVVVPANQVSLSVLSQTVTETNMLQVPLEERLSNQVYYYDKQSQEFTQVTDVPYNLDEIPELEEDSTEVISM